MMTALQFEIRCDADWGRFILRSLSSSETWEFPTLAAALKVAQELAAYREAHLTIYNPHGAVIVDSFV